MVRKRLLENFFLGGGEIGGMRGGVGKSLSIHALCIIIHKYMYA